MAAVHACAAVRTACHRRVCALAALHSSGMSLKARLHVAVQVSDADIIGSGGYVSQAQCVNTLQQLHQTLGKLQADILSHGPSNTLEHHCGSLPSSIQLIPACTAAFFCGTAIMYMFN